MTVDIPVATRATRPVADAPDASNFSNQSKIFSDSSSAAIDILTTVFPHSLVVFGSEDAFASPDAALGHAIADAKRRIDAAAAVSLALASPSIPDNLRNALAIWSEANTRSDHYQSAIATDRILATNSNHQPDASPLSHHLPFLRPASRWIINLDTLIDFQSSSIHQIVASSQNINVFAILSNPIEHEPEAANTHPARVDRDIGLYAMNYGNAYVASICPSYSYAQAVQAIKEADAFNGPSIVAAYLPNPKLLSSISRGPLDVITNVNAVIDQGLWSLYRWTPVHGRDPVLSLDSPKLKRDVQQFLDRNATLSLMLEPELTPEYKDPSLEAKLAETLQTNVQKSYDAMFAALNRKHLLVLYGSDGGNAEGIAKRIAHEANKKGLLVQIMAADAFPFDDLDRQEHVLFVVSTAGQGEFPGNCREIWKYLLAPTTPRFVSVKFAVFALGDRHYWPRPEDAHFFAKAGKDLDARLAALGATRLTETLGIGDDRDPDGFYTGYHAWASGFWTALGVEAESVEVQATAPSDDAIKEASNFLRGTIAEGLADSSTGALAEFDTKLTKFHGIYQQDDRDLRDSLTRRGLEKAYSFMIRVRVPGGIATPAQWLAIDEIADTHANGTIKITTRQAFQFHGILKSNLKQSVQGINTALMDTIAACGDVNRNVMCNPNPHDSTVHAQVLAFVRELSHHLTPRTSAYHEIFLDKKLVASYGNEEPMYGKTYLPRKFKTAVAVPPRNDVDVFAHDLGYIAVVEHGVLVGFNVVVGGGMGQTHGNKKTYPVLARYLGFCTVDQAIGVGETVLLVQRDYGDRMNRKHARLKYTIEDRGMGWFRQEVETRVGYVLKPVRPVAFTSNGDRYGWHQGTNGLWSYTMFIQNGRVKDTNERKTKTALAELARVHQRLHVHDVDTSDDDKTTGFFALTPNQHLIIGGIHPHHRDAINAVLIRYGLDDASNHGTVSGLRLNSMACVALPTCALAMAESERYLPTLIDKLDTILDEAGLRSESISIRMTGCPNGCARPQLSEIGFIGKAPGVYNMYLGGCASGQRLSKLYKSSVDETGILSDLRVLFHRFVRERLDDCERFGDFVVRVGLV